MTDILEMVQELKTTAAALTRENDAFERQVIAIEQAAEHADAYRQVVNAQASHNWGYYQHLHRDELDRYWAKSVDDIVYAHGREAFFGRESTYQYYIETPKKMCENGRINALKNYGIVSEAPDGPGYRVHNVISSPVVEIAGDGQTAQGIWMAHTFMSQITESGAAAPSFGLAKYGDEFYHEDGTWKMWHRRDYVDAMLPCNLRKEDPLENHIPLFSDGVKTIAQEGDMIYHPYSCTRREPAIPQPYETWDPAQSYIQIIRDGYEVSKEVSADD